LKKERLKKLVLTKIYIFDIANFKNYKTCLFRKSLIIK